MAWSGAVEINKFVLQFLPDRLCYQLGQLEVVNLLLPDNIELGTLGAPEVPLVFVVLRKVDDEHQTISHIFGVNVPPGAGLGSAGVSMDCHLGIELIA